MGESNGCSVLVKIRLCSVPRLTRSHAVSLGALQYCNAAKLAPGDVLQAQHTCVWSFRDIRSSQWVWKQACVCGCAQTGTDKGQGLGLTCRCLWSLPSSGWNGITSPAVTSHHSTGAPSETEWSFAAVLLLPSPQRVATPTALFRPFLQLVNELPVLLNPKGSSPYS